MKNVRDAMMVGHATDGTTVRRPLSPHLQVYKPQITSVLSIMNRISGVGSSVGTLLMVWWIVAAASGPAALATVDGFLGSPFGLLVMFGWTAAMVYHFVGGLRHLAWDAGYGFELPRVHMTGWAAVIATVVLTVAIFGAGVFLMRA